jgi:hypothetical protein
MITISGEVKHIPRIKIVPPDDGVHMRGVDGLMKGCHSFMIGDKLMPRGMVGFYWRLKGDKGVKVYYSFKHHRCTHAKRIKEIRRDLIRLSKYGLCKRPFDLCRAKLDLLWEGKRIRCVAVGLVVRHIHYPENVWMNYMKGYAYDWYALNQNEHPLHNPKGFLEFVDRKNKILNKIGFRIDERDRIGNTLYDIYDKRWWYVDVG